MFWAESHPKADNKKETKDEVSLVCKLENAMTELVFKMSKKTGNWFYNNEEYSTFSLMFKKNKWDFYK